MARIHISKFRVRYRLPRSIARERRRLDRVLGLLIDGELERAVEGAGVAPDEEICIRQLSCSTKLRLTASDFALAESWSHELAEAIRTAASTSLTVPGDRDESPLMVRFQSRSQALLDLAFGVAAGDLRRAWAWRQLGLWRIGDAATASQIIHELIHVLLREPTMIIPVLQALAQNHLLVPVADQLEERDWLALARAVFNRLAATFDPAAPRQQLTAAQPMDNAISWVYDSVTARLAQDLARSSLLSRELTALSLSSQGKAAFAALVLAEVEPGLTRRPQPKVRATLEALEFALFASAAGEGPKLAKPAGWRPSPSCATPKQADTGTLQEADTGSEANPLDSRENLPDRGRQRGFTEHGGLLFLLRVVEDLGLPAFMAENLIDRTVRWSMHALAVSLTNALPTDPAALAFAGLPPGAPPPGSEEQRLSQHSPLENEQLGLLVEKIQKELQRRLEQLNPGTAALLDFVCERPAQIVADPGWIYAHFFLNDVSTDLRRAALDLDPGYVPWLGVTIKFVYE